LTFPKGRGPTLHVSPASVEMDCTGPMIQAINCSQRSKSRLNQPSFACKSQDTISREVQGIAGQFQTAQSDKILDKIHAPCYGKSPAWGSASLGSWRKTETEVVLEAAAGTGVLRFAVKSFPTPVAWKDSEHPHNLKKTQKRELMMRIIEKLDEMQQQAESWRRQGKHIALVPTMGYLHRGHLALMKFIRPRADLVVASIFVNPTQFGPGEDLDTYPRDTPRDMKLLEDVGVDVLFMPQAEDVYPDHYQTYVEVKKVTQPLCGSSRPTHFRGVTTIVSKLFHLVKPRTAIFGEKDFQQLVTIRRMVKDLNMDVEIIGHPIVREEDGLAMSSRNVYLTPEQRLKALRLSRSLAAAEDLVKKGERNGNVILQKVREIIAEDQDGDVRIDYAELRQPDTLDSVDRIDGPTLLALAVFIGSTRLIDNRVL